MNKQIFTNETIREGGLLLHTCCGPCTEYPLHDLQERGIVPEFYYLNPNIHPEKEWQKRYESLVLLADREEIRLHVNKAYADGDWADLGKAPNRCHFCYTIRMKGVAQKAKELGLAFFSTSLLVSPYQHYETILLAGKRAGEQYGVSFLAEDWRDHFREGQNMAREHNLYRQKYCGCILSLNESQFKDKIISQQECYDPDALCPIPEPFSYRT